MTPAQITTMNRHAAQVLAIFPTCTISDPVLLCRKLYRIERAAHKAAEDYCSGYIENLTYEDREKHARAQLRALLGPALDSIPVFINSDPRGCALKIHDDWIRNNPDHPIARDWGGYGLLAPTIDKHGNI